MPTPRFAVAIAAAFALSLSSYAENAYRLMAPSDLPALSGRFEPGDVVLLPDAAWDGANLVFKGRGTAEKPITLRASTPGKFSLKGQSSLVIDGEWLVVEGITLDGVEAKDAAVTIKGRHNRLTESAIESTKTKPLVRVTGEGHQVDRCAFSGAAAEAIAVDAAAAQKAGPVLEQNMFAAEPAGASTGAGPKWKTGTAGKAP